MARTMPRLQRHVIAPSALPETWVLSLRFQANEPSRTGLAARNPMFPLVDMGANQVSRRSFLSRKERGGDIQDGPVAEIIAIL